MLHCMLFSFMGYICEDPKRETEIDGITIIQVLANVTFMQLLLSFRISSIFSSVSSFSLLLPSDSSYSVYRVFMSRAKGFLKKRYAADCDAQIFVRYTRRLLMKVGD